uniref:Reverse transcriptase domain-containing protein n=1 Tax=Monodelphis domestica TaxID=13616 RepID=A0A5F8GYV1_MONDO
MRGAECWTDHQLVRATLQMYIAPRHPKRAQTVRAFYNVSHLRDPSYLQTFQSCLDDKLSAKGPLTGSSTEKWNQFRDAVKETSKTVLGPKQRNHQDWFDKNNTAIEDLLNKKNKVMEWQNNPNSAPKKDRFKSLQATVQCEIRKMQDQWWGKKAEEIQRFADTKNYKQFFSALKTVYGPLKPITTPLLSSDGDTLIKDKKGISNRWKEDFSRLLNRLSSVDQSALDQIPQNHTFEQLDVPPSIEEVQKAIKQMSAGKAPGKVRIPTEVYKALNGKALQAFHIVLTSIWEEEGMPPELRDASIIALYKNKVTRTACDNYRGISLLSTAGKILAHVILNRLLSSVSEQNLPESQCGFRPDCSTIDMVFTVRQMQEKCLEQNPSLYIVSIDLTKVFHTVNRDALWVILNKLSCPAKFVKLIQLFHVDMTGEVLSGGETSDHFNISNVVKQGCILAPVLFNLYFTQVLQHVVMDLDLGIYIKYRLDGSLFDLRRLTAKTKTTERLILEALFADDCALMAHQENHLHCGQVLYSNKTVWPDYQPQQNRGAVPTCTRQANEPSMHYNRRHTAF